MRHVREILRLSLEAGLSTRVIGERTGVGATTVRDMLKRFARSGLNWPVPVEMSDADLESCLYGLPGVKPGRRKQPEPDWSAVVCELKRKHVTLQVLWEEYIGAHPDGYRYSRWCDLFRRWEGRLPLTMRQHHAGGEKMFVDYAGDTVPVVVDRRTGEVRDAHLFVAVLGGSSLSFACATWTERFADWIEAHNSAFAFFGGVAHLLVPDNAKVAVIKACHFDPMVNRSYTDMARHCGTAVLPARPRKPRDKAKVEACVGIVERWVLGRLRNRIFYSLAEVNIAVAECIADLNEIRVLRQFGKTRRHLFEEIDAPNLKPLPIEPWVHAEWKRCRVGLDYHIAIEHHHYSVPWRFARREVEARITARTVEIFLEGERIAAHMRGSGNGRHTTIPEHMPSSHRRYREWTPLKIREEAARIGPMLSLLVEKIIEDRPHPEQGYRSCLGIIGLEKRFGTERLEAAARRALEIQARNYPSVKSILEKGLDKVPVRKARSTRRSSTPTSGAPDITTERTAMLKHPTLELLGQLGLAGMAHAFTELESNSDAANLSHAEWLALLLDHEATYRNDRRLALRLRHARLRHHAVPEDVDYRAARGLDRRLFDRLLKGDWIAAHESLAIIGPAGVGKSWLACAIGHKACRDNRSVLYTRLPRLIDDLSLAKGDGRIAARMKSLARVDLLILDDWGLEPLDGNARHHLLEILEDRYGRRSTLVTSQLPVARWFDLIGDPTYADAILDRLIHNAHRLELSGESMRRSTISAAA